jgi:acyl-CoA reductase-like NAD-dependent aldehyde dehydrogenase
MIQIRNPATGEICGEAAAQSSAEVTEALGRASAASLQWRARAFPERAALLRRLARGAAGDERLMTALVSETGKPRYEAEGIELLYLLELTRFLSGSHGRAALADDVRRPFLFRHKRARVIHHPLGVVGVIGPWNWPLLNNFGDCVAPLLAGNAVVLKPSSLTPLTSIRMAELWRETGMPADVFQVVTGGAETGQALIDGVDLVFFTGSTEVGRGVARRAAERLIPAILELGGKSPMIVLADADLPRAARAAVWSAFANCGQVCIRTERVLVDRRVADEFQRLVVVAAAELRQSSTASGDFDVGPTVQLAHLEFLERQIADAVARGARVVLGGIRRADLGPLFFAPTVLTGCTSDMAVMVEETFGPVLPIMSFDDEADVIRMANRPAGGLSGSVWSRDTRRARNIARQLTSGSVCINDALVNYLCVEAPLAGAASSGLGFRHGAEALRQFCRVETIVEDRAVLGWLSPFISRRLGFPYRADVLRLVRWLMRKVY